MTKQIKVEQVKMLKTYPYPNDIFVYVPVAEAKLILVECQPEEALLFKFSAGGKISLYNYSMGLVKGLGFYLKPILISETEKIEESDYGYGKNTGVLKITNPLWAEQEKLKKVLALPENFSPTDLQSIVDGKLKDGDKVLVECSNIQKIIEKDAPVDYSPVTTIKDSTFSHFQIKLNSSNQITVYHVESIDNKIEAIMQKHSFNELIEGMKRKTGRFLIIHKVEDGKLYSKEEVLYILKKFHDTPIYSDMDMSSFLIKWFEQNVK